MWVVSGNSLTMTEGDFGVALPVSVTGAAFTDGDTIRFTFKQVANGAVILKKDFPAASPVSLVLTAQESAKFPVGTYVYSLDWYREGSYMCNIIPSAGFKVVDKI